MKYLSEIIIVVISAFMGGLITYIFDNMKERRQNKKDKKNKLEEINNNRPEFTITEMVDFFDLPGYKKAEAPCDLEIFTAGFKQVEIKNDDIFVNYDKEYLDKEAWVCRKYTLKNVGKTPVYELSIISNYKRDTCICDVEIQEELINEGLLNYSVIYDRRIGSEETITLKIYYHKEKIRTGFISAIFSLGMRDYGGNFWIQPFFAPEDKLYESRLISYQEYRDALLTDNAIKCFKEPYLW